MGELIKYLIILAVVVSLFKYWYIIIPLLFISIFTVRLYYFYETVTNMPQFFYQGQSYHMFLLR